MSQSNDNFFKLSVEPLLEGIQIIDPDYRYVYINDVAAKQGKYKKEDYLGKTMMEMYPDIERADFFLLIKEVLQNSKRARMQNQFVYPDGVKCWFELLFEPHPMGVLIRSLDITERKSK
ncbi:PAS domain-containing protein [bacterium]|nr:PAS domain-containing protein [bacterium]